MISFAPLLPLFVPSFSSKGNLFLPQSSEKYISDNYSLLQALDVRVSRSYLVSAYDIYYGYMPQNPSDWPETEYLFIDSGGYEISDSFDFSEGKKFNYRVLPWDKDKMKEIYCRVVDCPKFRNTSIILSSYDTTGSIEFQLAEALSLAKDFPIAIIDFIIKGCSPIEDFLSNISGFKSALESISIIGFTEKELGYTIRDRLLNLIKVKRQLAACGWQGSIHVFGGLEPNLATLYYIAGADIFDGLSWQRMYYRNGASTYNPEAICVSLPEHENKFLMMVDNLWIIQNVSNSLSTIFDMRLTKMDLLESFLKSEEVTIKDIITVLEV